MESEPRRRIAVRIWDPFLRVFHWLFAGSVILAWFFRSEAAVHETAGKVALCLIVFRAAWGIVGPASARFREFVRGPKATLAYLLSIAGGKPPHCLGHNPAGAAMIAALLATVAVTCASGILMTTTAFWGNATVEAVHGVSALFIPWLVAGHLAGVALATIQHKENIVASMITGSKASPEGTHRYLGKHRLDRRAIASATAIILASAGIWLGSVTLFNASAWRMERILKAKLSEAGCANASVSGPRMTFWPDAGLNYVIDASGGRSEAFIPAGLALARKPDMAQIPAGSWCPPA